MFFRQIARALALSCAAALLAGAAHAQQFPSKPITILVGYGAGGTTDAIARLYAAKLQDLLKTPVIVDNRPGASELQAIRPVIAAPPDGYTLYLGTGGALGQGPAIRKDLNYDPMKNFSPVAMVAVGEAVLVVRPDVPVHSLSELIKYAKANPGKMSYGSGGIGFGKSSCHRVHAAGDRGVDRAYPLQERHGIDARYRRGKCRVPHGGAVDGHSVCP